MGYVGKFFAGIDADELSMVVRHCDIAAEDLVIGEPPLLLEDDMTPLDDDTDHPAGA